MAIPDPIRAGLARGWHVEDGSRLEADHTVECDVAIIGTGAGGGIAADVLSAAGLKVLLLEEGGLYSSDDFDMREATAYPRLYQESAARQTRDKGVTILQGRTVGGSTVVNWTSSFRTPPTTLGWWRDTLGLPLDADTMAPWFERAEARVNVSDWLVEPNPNNHVLGAGAARLGIPFGHIRRNVKGCWNLGYCGMGCPTNAKQSMLVTTLPAALARGATLWQRMRAERLILAGDAVTGLRAVALAADGLNPTGRILTVRARQVLLAGGAINTPALLLRSQVPDPHELIGAHTCLHPTVVSGAQFDRDIRPFDGAPQSLYSDHFLHVDPIDGPPGFKLEVPPVHPLLAGVTLSGWGADHARLMADLPRLNVIIALVRDGFHPELRGGRVGLRDDGSPVLDYPLTDTFWQAARRALLAMAKIQFAAGARAVLPMAENARLTGSWREAKALLDDLPLAPLTTRVVSAHVMGGCAMGRDERDGVCDSDGRVYRMRNLSVADGSLFPTSLGANPQLSVYAFAWKVAARLAREMGGAAA